MWFGENDIRWFNNTDYSSKVMSFVGRKLMGKGQFLNNKKLTISGIYNNTRSIDLAGVTYVYRAICIYTMSI